MGAGKHKAHLPVGPHPAGHHHGAGLAVLHPALYRHLCPAEAGRFARFARNVWGIDPAGKSELEQAQAGIEALAAFIREIGLPTNFAELGIPADTDLKAVADSAVRKILKTVKTQ